MAVTTAELKELLLDDAKECTGEEAEQCRELAADEHYLEEWAAELNGEPFGSEHPNNDLADGYIQRRVKERQNAPKPANA